jgi:cytochrome c-type biogenesis protein CcmH
MTSLRTAHARLRWSLILLSAFALTLAAQDVTARYTPEVEAEARALFTRIMSPYCPGLTLTTCPSEGAVILKDSIRAELAAGRTADELMRALEERFGEAIHASPPARGFGLIAWGMPFAALAIAGLALTWRLRGARARGIAAASPMPARPSVPPVTGVLDADSLARIDAAVRDEG